MEKNTSRAVTSMDMNTLEAIIDRIGLESTLDAIADVCLMKHEHILEAYQDELLADTWDLAARHIQRTSNHSKAILAVSGRTMPVASKLPIVKKSEV